jgi:serpin B
MGFSIKFLLVMVASSFCLSGCSPSTTFNSARSDLPRNINPNVSQDDLTTLVDGNNTFALNFYRSLRTTDGNLVFSPFSISTALAMTYAGASGETQSQMAQALQFHLPQDRLHPAFDQLDLTLTREGQSGSDKGQPMQLDIANATWAEKTYKFLPSYLDTISKNYGAGIQLADFVNNSESVKNNINQWVGDETHQRIKDLIQGGAIDPTTRLVLINAIYFKADWKDQFDPTDTREASFHLLDGSVSQVRMMSNTLFDAPYSSGNGYQAVELKYLGETAVMDILVPDDGTFRNFEDQLSNSKLDEILAGMQTATVALDLPKFGFKSNVDLGHLLADLGMPDAFDPNLADFSGMTGGRDLFISKALHQAFVSVDEKGTEAAAATSVIMAPTSILRTEVNLTIDRPFVFLIRDVASKQILFFGRVLDPSK